eukprot:SAG11_NODE_659_length_7895_cov_18.189969_5_plen_93_part_00
MCLIFYTPVQIDPPRGQRKANKILWGDFHGLSYHVVVAIWVVLTHPTKNCHLADHYVQDIMKRLDCIKLFKAQLVERVYVVQILPSGCLNFL